jgi:hypothetical protein
MSDILGLIGWALGSARGSPQNQGPFIAQTENWIATVLATWLEPLREKASMPQMQQRHGQSATRLPQHGMQKRRA